jgi:hypothetical protein
MFGNTNPTGAQPLGYAHVHMFQLHTVFARPAHDGVHQGIDWRSRLQLLGVHCLILFQCTHASIKVERIH